MNLALLVHLGELNTFLWGATSNAANGRVTD
jgi:hypothetical protein